MKVFVQKTFLYERKRRMLQRRLFALLSAVFILVSSISGEAMAAGMPPLDSQAEAAEITEILQKYDKDGAYLTKDPFSNILFFEMLKLTYFSEGQKAVDACDVSVHESYHKFAQTKNIRKEDGTLSGGSEKVYIGKKKAVTVKFTPVFFSREMVDSIPKRCRSTSYHYPSGDRFAVYVVDENGLMDSDTNGVYGLLNEFTGYCWGLNANNKTFSYRQNFPYDANTWEGFYSDGENDRLAYMQFKYYILHYMIYAKEHYPAVYKKLVANKSLTKAYRLVEKQFAGEVAEYEKLIKKASAKAASKGNTVYTVKLPLDKEYNALKKELKKTQYVKMHSIMTK